MPRKRILVIDDEDDIREIATLTLELTCGWEIAAAGSGREGIDLARTDHPDAILLDVMMPDLDGPSTLAALRSDAATCDIPVIFLTAKVQSSDRQRFHQLGVRGVIAKPFDPMALGWQVAGILDWG
jgi:CheY-like chemotaxis protein